jgi:hypothetical protein
MLSWAGGLVRPAFPRPWKEVTFRYWVSMTWSEAEPASASIDNPKGKEWFKRLKVRFDWVDDQGDPWWTRNASNTATITPPPDFAVDPTKPDDGGSSTTSAHQVEVCSVNEVLRSPSPVIIPRSTSPRMRDDLLQTDIGLCKPPSVSQRDSWSTSISPYGLPTPPTTPETVPQLECRLPPYDITSAEIYQIPVTSSASIPFGLHVKEPKAGPSRSRPDGLPGDLKLSSFDFVTSSAKEQDP